MSAETLRKAAALMRERAEAARAGRWIATQDAVVAQWEDGPRWVAQCEGSHDVGNAINATHIASWHPAVAIAVSRLLDAVAEHVASRECEAHCEPGGCAESRDALDLSRAYLGADA